MGGTTDGVSIRAGREGFDGWVGPPMEFQSAQGGRDSNPRPLVLETSALTRLSYRPNGDESSPSHLP